MRTADLLLYVAALVLFVLGSVSVQSRVNLIGFGLACWVLVPLLDLVHTSG